MYDSDKYFGYDQDLVGVVNFSQTYPSNNDAGGLRPGGGWHLPALQQPDVVSRARWTDQWFWSA